jgi:hypothetical protein
MVDCKIVWLGRFGDDKCGYNCHTCVAYSKDIVSFSDCNPGPMFQSRDSGLALTGCLNFVNHMKSKTDGLSRWGQHVGGAQRVARRLV